MPDFSQRLRREIVLWLLSVGGILPLIMLVSAYPIFKNAQYTLRSFDHIGWYVGNFSSIFGFPYYLFPIFFVYHAPNMIFHCLRMERPLRRLVYEYPIFLIAVISISIVFASNIYEFHNCIRDLYLERARGIKIIYEMGDPCHWDWQTAKIGQSLYFALAVVVSLRAAIYLYTFVQQKRARK